MLSVVLPAYNEEKMIQKAAGTIGGILQKEAIDYEIIFVDDGSKDGTWQQIEQTQKKISMSMEFVFQKFRKRICHDGGTGKCRWRLRCCDGL